MGRNILYKDSETYIRQKIESGELKPGEQIPTEKELQQQFSLSRMTVNKALNILADEGYITRTAGKGSFVCYPRSSRKQRDLISFCEETECLGMIPGTSLIQYEVIPAGNLPEVRKKLNLQESDLIHHFIRLHTGSGIPLAVSDTCVPVKLISSLDIGVLSSSFHKWLKTQPFPLLRADRCLSVCIPDNWISEYLQNKDEAVMKKEQTVYAESDHGEFPLEYTVLYCSRQYRYNDSVSLT